MRRATLFLVAMTSVAALVGSGCGVDETVYNAAVKDRDAQKQQLSETQKSLSQEKAVPTPRTTISATHESWRGRTN